MMTVEESHQVLTFSGAGTPPHTSMKAFEAPAPQSKQTTNVKPKPPPAVAPRGSIVLSSARRESDVLLSSSKSVKRLLMKKRAKTELRAVEATGEGVFSAVDHSRKKWVVYPEDSLMRVWDILILLSVLWNVIYAPLALAFQVNGPGLDGLDFFTDGVFIVDLAVNMRSAYYHYTLSEKFIIDDSKLMLLHYIKSWFIIDLLSIGIPFVNTDNDFVRLMSLFKVFRIFKLFRLITRLTESLAMVIQDVLLLVRLLCLLLLIGHWSGCLLWYVGKLEATRECGVDFRQDSTCETGWVAITVNGLYKPHELEVSHQYTLSLYWAIATILTVGYGDIVPVTELEMTFTIICSIAGALVYTFIIGNVTLMLTNMQQTRVRHHSRIKAIEEFIRVYSINDDLADRIHSHTDYVWDINRGFNPDQLMKELPPNLVGDLKWYIHKEVISKIPFFKEASESMIRCILDKLTGLHLMQHEYLFHAGDLANAMFIIRKGEIQVLNENKVPLATLKAGAFFGEIALFQGGFRSASAKTTRISNLYILSKADFDGVVDSFPSFKEIVKRTAMQRLKQDVKRKATLFETVDMIKKTVGKRADAGPKPRKTPVTVHHGRDSDRQASGHFESLLMTRLDSMEHTLNERLDSIEKRIGKLQRDDASWHTS